MKAFVLLLLGIILTFATNYKVENRYLEHIIEQNNFRLLKSSLPNTHKTIKELIQNKQTDGVLLHSGAKLAYKLKRYKLAVYYLILKKGLFKDDKLYSEDLRLYELSIKHLNLDKSYLDIYNQNFKGLRDVLKILLLFDMQSLKKDVYFLIKQYAQDNNSAILWIQQWQYLNFIDKLEYYNILTLDTDDFTDNRGISLFKNIDSKTENTLITAQIIKLYNINAYKEATLLYKKYQQDIGIWNKTIILIYRLKGLL